MSHKEITDFGCPKCGGYLEFGYIAGHWIRLRWCKMEKTKTIFSGSPLRKKRDLWNSPTLIAGRCDKCKIGIFTYDN
jgi:hypothetical protein